MHEDARIGPGLRRFEQSEPCIGWYHSRYALDFWAVTAGSVHQQDQGCSMAQDGTTARNVWCSMVAGS